MYKIMICVFLFVASGLFAQETLSFDIGDWEPFTSSRDPNSQILELLVREIFALYDVEVQYHYYPWLRSLKNVENGDSDGSFPLIKTPERDKKTICSQEPILVEETVFFHLKDLKFDWSSFEDLESYTIGGTIGYAYMDPLLNHNLLVEYVPYEELNFRQLEARHIDIYPASRYVGIYLINMLFDETTGSQFTFHPKILNRQVYYLLVSRENPHAQDIIDKFDEGIRILKENGRYDEIMDLLPDLEFR